MEQGVFENDLLRHVLVAQLQKRLETLGILDGLISAQDGGVDGVGAGQRVIQLVIGPVRCFSLAEHFDTGALRDGLFTAMLAFHPLSEKSRQSHSAKCKN